MKIIFLKRTIYLVIKFAKSEILTNILGIPLYILDNIIKEKLNLALIF